MAKELTKRLLLTGIGSMVATVLLCVFVFSGVIERQVQQELHLFADMISAAYYQAADQWTPEEYSNMDVRVTLIQADGTVLGDNKLSDVSENYLNRPEVESALRTGEGSAERKSSTLDSRSYYYALRLDDGNILRVSINAHGQYTLFHSAVPALLIYCILIVGISVLLSVLLTKSFVRPIVKMGEHLDEIDWEVPYPEMKPFVDSIVRDRTIRRQNENMRQEFTANVSHELKTPLTSISGYAELIETGIARPEDVQNFAQKIHKEANRLLHLVNDIIQLSKLDTAQDAKHPKMDFEMMDLKDVVLSCVDQLGVNAQRAYVTLLYEGGNAAILGNRSAIEEMCINLCDNAIRYNKPGGKVEVSCGMVEGHPYLRVADNGIGIPSEQQERVFERFYRVDKSRSKESGGTGLGLAIVKHLAALHGGQIELHSEVGKGTDIRVLFPAVKK